MSLLNPNLQAFIKIIECQTVHGAAKALFLTQTAVTQRIRALERELQINLFVRTRKGMIPTKEALQLLNFCQSSLKLENELMPKLGNFHKNNPEILKICGPTSIMLSRVVPQTMKIMKNSALIFRYEFDDFENRIDKIKKGVMDFALISSQSVPLEVESKQLSTENFVLIAPKPWLKVPIRKIIEEKSIIDFDPEDQMTFSYLKKYNLHHKVFPHRIFANNIEALIKLIEAGHGYGVIAEELIDSISQKNICILNSGKSLDFKMSLVWMKQSFETKNFQLVKECIQ
jgi:LysR family transcriptional regulator (chromosome initiation inhibitor)